MRFGFSAAGGAGAFGACLSWVGFIHVFEESIVVYSEMMIERSMLKYVHLDKTTSAVFHLCTLVILSHLLYSNTAQEEEIIV